MRLHITAKNCREALEKAKVIYQEGHDDEAPTPILVRLCGEDLLTAPGATRRCHVVTIEERIEGRDDRRRWI